MTQLNLYGQCTDLCSIIHGLNDRVVFKRATVIFLYVAFSCVLLAERNFRRHFGHEKNEPGIITNNEYFAESLEAEVERD